MFMYDQNDIDRAPRYTDFGIKRSIVFPSGFGDISSQSAIINGKKREKC